MDWIHLVSVRPCKAGMKRARTLEKKISLRISRSRREVFMRKDFEDLGSYRSVGYCLSKLVEQEKLIRIGRGIYAKATIGPLWHQVIPRRGLRSIREALERLGVKTTSSSAERRYNSGLTTQVPTGRVIGVNKIISRKLGYNGTFVTLELMDD